MSNEHARKRLEGMHEAKMLRITAEFDANLTRIEKEMRQELEAHHDILNELDCEKCGAWGAELYRVKQDRGMWRGYYFDKEIEWDNRLAQDKEARCMTEYCYTCNVIDDQPTECKMCGGEATVEHGYEVFAGGGVWCRECPLVDVGAITDATQTNTLSLGTWTGFLEED